MADWATLGWRISKTANVADVFLELLNKMTIAQAEFLLEDDPVAECLEYWLQEPKNVGREITSGELYKEFTSVAEANKIPFSEACSSPRGFGKKIKGSLKALQNFYSVESREDNRSRRYYKFTNKNDKEK
jgi:hypothetical protein